MFGADDCSDDLRVEELWDRRRSGDGAEEAGGLLFVVVETANSPPPCTEPGPTLRRP
jgi:hypothetical protein